MIAIRAIFTVLFLGAFFATAATWFYALYHFRKSGQLFWEIRGEFEGGLKGFFWPEIEDTAGAPPLTPALVHRNKYRRARSVFLGIWIFAMGAGLAAGCLEGHGAMVSCGLPNWASVARVEKMETIKEHARISPCSSNR
jgi:hypothetical protein